VKVYVASSWRNEQYQHVVQALKTDGHDVFDWKDPRSAFHWREIGPEWAGWTSEQLRSALEHPLVQRAFAADMGGLRRCEVCVLIEPCGTSAHMELGYAVGSGKPTCVLLDGGNPETMYKMVSRIAVNLGEVKQWLKSLEGLQAGSR
jgi:nucleoside 2-deoxyribosyltransferase